jgi:hypothetical protein
MKRAFCVSRASHDFSIKRTGLSALCVVLLAAVGCTREPGGTQGALSVPPSGSVRVLSRTIPPPGGGIHHKWSLIGERNWSEATATGTELRLGQPSPLNDPAKKSGCNIWECDLTVTPKSGDPNTLVWKTRIHGSDGTTAESGGENAVSGGLDAVRIELGKDSVQRLPASLTLARIGDRTVTLSVTK